MLRFVPFEAWHALELVSRNAYRNEEQGLIPVVFSPESAKLLEDEGDAYACLDGSSIIACGGLLKQWEGRYSAWAFFTPEAGRYMVTIHRFTREKLGKTAGRIELTVISDYEKGHIWAKMLGFHVETPTLEKYGPVGEDHTGYVRINEAG